MVSAAIGRVVYPLLALNFFMADIQAGIGPFLGVYLQQHGWQPGLIGTIMTVGGIVGMLTTTPAGIWIDNTSKKRLCVMLACVCSVIACGVLLISQEVWVVTISQIATAIAGSAILPAVAGITLGIVGQRGFNKQNGRNQAVNHAGNAIGAALSGLLGWLFGFAAVFWLAGAFGVLAILSTLAIPEQAIDHRAARGTSTNNSDAARGLGILVACKPLLILGIALACFHLGNAAMLPLYGMATAANHQGDPASIVAMTIVVAQIVMVVASIIAMRLAESDGYWMVLLISFLALPARGLLASYFISRWGVYPVQILDGIGAGLQSSRCRAWSCASWKAQAASMRAREQ